jgi:hypothetical protein
LKTNAADRDWGRGIRRIFSVRNRIAKLALSLVGVAPLLARRPANAYPYSGLEMWRLYYDMRRRQPETVMEFGVGCSTIVIAAALHRNNKGRLFTVDASEEWLSVCRDALPEHLRRRVEFVYSPVEVIPGEQAHRYSRLPDVSLDYLFIDGPSVQHVPSWEGPPVAADPVLSDMKFNEGARIMVEGRPRNVQFLRERLGSNWRMEKDRFLAFSWVSFNDRP